MLAILPPVTRALLLTNIGVFLLQQLIGPIMLQWFALWPPGSLFEPWQLVTYAFLHAGPTHILMNMFGLFMFGTPVERYLGPRRFSAYYLLCVITAALTQMAVAMFEHSMSPTLGASGAIFGLLLAFAMFYPREKVMLIFLPIPLPAWAFVTLYGLIELFLGVTGNEANVAHFAHLGGMLGGAATILFWRFQDGALKS